MKKLVVIMIVVVAVALVGNHLTNFYKMNGYVIADNNGVLTIEDTRGELWTVENNEFKYDDYVTVKFYNNNTLENIYDDEIVSIEKR